MVSSRRLSGRLGRTVPFRDSLRPVGGDAQLRENSGDCSKQKATRKAGKHRVLYLFEEADEQKQKKREAKKECH